MPENLNQVIFNSKDEFALNGAIVLANSLKLEKKYFDSSNFNIQCAICFIGLNGQKEALNHGKKTGHNNFQQVDKDKLTN